jgi:hypothetical protein
MQFSDRCAPWKIASGVENLVLQELQVQRMDLCRKFLRGTSISHYGSNDFLWKVSLMLEVNCTFFNWKYVLINALKAFASIIFI